mmetsp:Transcript_15033/g.44257  ORF Transcript_15033/g.44257 Transcript_15033/m.44257 type:complete len:313 (-) Transcript_15033:17-955(-)
MEEAPADVRRLRREAVGAERADSDEAASVRRRGQRAAAARVLLLAEELGPGRVSQEPGGRGRRGRAGGLLHVPAHRGAPPDDGRRGEDGGRRPARARGGGPQVKPAGPDGRRAAREGAAEARARRETPRHRGPGAVRGGARAARKAGGPVRRRRGAAATAAAEAAAFASLLRAFFTADFDLIFFLCLPILVFFGASSSTPPSDDLAESKTAAPAPATAPPTFSASSLVVDCISARTASGGPSSAVITLIRLRPKRPAPTASDALPIVNLVPLTDMGCRSKPFDVVLRAGAARAKFCRLSKRAPQKSNLRGSI